jgi:hypothetical protein
VAYPTALKAICQIFEFFQENSRCLGKIRSDGPALLMSGGLPLG